MVKKEINPYGYIYRATNRLNGKNYVGQTVTSRWGNDEIPIEARWKEEIRESYSRNRRGEELRNIEKAIVKYGPENFVLREQDRAYSQEDLDAKETYWIKDYDSMNPDKGYNMTEGGLGGRPSDEVRENISNIITDKWDKDPVYRNKQANERSERGQNPEFIEKMTRINKEKGKNPEFKEKMTKINQEKAKNPEWREKMSQVGKEKWNEDPEYRDKQTNERRERAKNPEWREKMTRINREITQRPEYKEKMSQISKEKWKDPEYQQKQIDSHDKYKKKIEDKREFLNEVKNKVPKKELVEKYGMAGKTLNRRIEEMFGSNGPKNYTELKDHLQDKNVDDVLKDIDNRSGERQDSSSENTKENKKEEVPEESKQEGNKDEKQSEEKGKDINDKESEESVEEKPEVSSEEITEKSTEESMDEGKEESTEPQSEGKENQLETLINITEDNNIRGQKTKEKRDKEDENHRYILTSGAEQRQQLQRSSKDYDGIDESPDDKRSDYDGIDTNPDNDKSDIKTLNGGFNEQGNDYDGIDNPQESVDKDYDNVDESYGEGGYEG